VGGRLSTMRTHASDIRAVLSPARPRSGRLSSGSRLGTWSLYSYPPAILDKTLKLVVMVMLLPRTSALGTRSVRQPSLWHFTSAVPAWSSRRGTRADIFDAASWNDFGAADPLDREGTRARHYGPVLYALAVRYAFSRSRSFGLVRQDAQDNGGAMATNLTMPVHPPPISVDQAGENRSAQCEAAVMRNAGGQGGTQLVIA